MKTRLRQQINRALHDAIPCFDTCIPLGKIFEIVETAGFMPIQEDGERWSGLLCGHDGSCSIELVEIASGKKQAEAIQLQWYGERTHGRRNSIETNVYVM